MAMLNMSEAEMDGHIPMIRHRLEVLGPEIRARLIKTAHEHKLPLSRRDDETVAQAANEGMVFSEFPTAHAPMLPLLWRESWDRPT